MSKVIINKRLDGGCDVVIPAPALLDPTSRDRIELNEKGILLLTATEDDVLAFIMQKDAPNGRITDISNVPSDRYFRNAWTDNNPTVTVDVDMTKAVDIHKDYLRGLRKPKLEALDVAFMKAIEEGVSVATITAEKQALRDATADPAIAAAATPDELKQVIPDCLKN